MPRQHAETCGQLYLSLRRFRELSSALSRAPMEPCSSGGRPTRCGCTPPAKDKDLSGQVRLLAASSSTNLSSSTRKSSILGSNDSQDFLYCVGDPSPIPTPLRQHAASFLRVTHRFSRSTRLLKTMENEAIENHGKRVGNLSVGCSGTSFRIRLKAAKRFDQPARPVSDDR